MSPEEFHRKKLKEQGYKPKVINKIVQEYTDSFIYAFAERYHEDNLKGRVVKLKTKT